MQQGLESAPRRAVGGGPQTRRERSAQPALELKQLILAHGLASVAPASRDNLR